MRFVRPAIRLVVVFAMVAGAGQAAAPAPSTMPAATVRAPLRHDLSAPIRTITRVGNQTPPLVGSDPDADLLGHPPYPGTRAPVRDRAVQNTFGASEAPEPVVGFQGMENSGYMPPDPNGDVGPNDYVQAVNASFEVFDKQGHRLFGPQPIAGVWHGLGGPCENQGRGDPIVLYDSLADRWLLSEFAYGISGDKPAGPYYECIAVSRTGDPTGSWFRYTYLISNTLMDDYPKLGVWPDGYYMSVNQYDSSGTWAGVGVVAFDRQAMLAGEAAPIVYVQPGNSNGMLPADLDGSTPPPAGSPEYFVGFDVSNWGAGLSLWRFHVDWANPSAASFSSPVGIPVESFDAALCNFQSDCIRQAGTTVGLNPNSYRLMYRLAYRNFGDHESLVVNHTVVAGAPDHAGVRWYEIRDPGGSPFVFQQGTFAPDADSRFSGSIAMDRMGDIAMGYTVAGLGMHPSVRFTGRLAGDPSGEMTQGEGSIVEGTGSQTDNSHRWGDYSSISVDPVDDCTFWYTNEYFKTNNPWMWATRVGAFRLPGCQSAPGLVVSDAHVSESDGTATFTVTQTPPVESTVSVDYTTVDGSAVGGEDYVPQAGTLTFAPGETSKTIDVPIVDDSKAEPTESFTLQLSNPVGAPVIDGQGAGTIDDDDGVARADGMIRGPTGPRFAGTRIYNVTGWHQTRIARLHRGQLRAFVIRIQNRGTAPASVRVHGPHSSRAFRLRYRLAGGYKVTKLVASGRLTLRVPAHQQRTLRLKVKATRKAWRGLQKSFLVLVRSEGSRPRGDAVRARVRVVR